MCIYYAFLIVITLHIIGSWCLPPIRIDDAGVIGRRFDGIGAVSGGGASSKLLVNYPLEYRNQILDFLFKPNFGASLHLLKVEIGGDTQSGMGSEASHMHTATVEEYNLGYEWWLMTEAKARNPDILLYGLPWGFPSWIGAGTESPYANIQNTAQYVVNWIRGAKEQHNLTIDFVGIWNERTFNLDYIKELRTFLDSSGFNNVQIVAADGLGSYGWSIAQDLLNDPILNASVSVIGQHYPNTTSPQVAMETGKPLWASEDYSTFNDNIGGGCWARILNQNYVNGNMTGTIAWNLIASYYSSLPYGGDGLMTANEPWSGHYDVQSPIWMTAHTSQFTRPGWIYLAHGSGVGYLPSGGTYVSFTSPDHQQLTIVIETMTRNHSKCLHNTINPYTIVPQAVVFQLSGSFVGIMSLNIWYSKLSFNATPATFMKKLPSIQPSVTSSFELGLDLDEVWTITTLTSGLKGIYPPSPPSMAFPLPYADDFEAYKLKDEPFNFAQQLGVYEVVNVGAPHNNVIRQVVTAPPVTWCGPDKSNQTVSLIGNGSWTDIYVEVEASILFGLNSTSGVFIAARVDRGGCYVAQSTGLYFFLYPKENLYVLSASFVYQEAIAFGAVPVQEWNKLGLLIKTGFVTGSINDKVVFNVAIPTTIKEGFAAIGTSTYATADFDNLALKSAEDEILAVNAQSQNKMDFVVIR